MKVLDMPNGDREVCPNCGYWANTVIDSDDLL